MGDFDSLPEDEKNLFFQLSNREKILECRLSNEAGIISTVNVIQRFHPESFAADEEFLRATRAEAQFNMKSISLELDSVRKELKQASQKLASKTKSIFETFEE